jgi:hypothetical protein
MVSSLIHEVAVEVLETVDVWVHPWKPTRNRTAAKMDRYTLLFMRKGTFFVDKLRDLLK